MESTQDILRNHEKRITRTEVEISVLKDLKIDHRLDRVDKVFFAGSIGLAFGLWLLANTPKISTFFEAIQ